MKEKKMIIIIVSIAILIFLGYLLDYGEKEREKRHKKIDRIINKSTNYILNAVDSTAAIIDNRNQGDFTSSNTSQ